MKLFKELEENLMLVFMAIVTAFILLGWVLGFVAKDQVAVTTEVAQYAYTWFTFLAFGLSVKKHLFMKIDVLTSRYSERIQQFLSLIIDVILFFICVVFLILGTQSFMIHLASGEINAKVAIPVAVVYLAPVVGFGMAVFRYIEIAVVCMRKKED